MVLTWQHDCVLLARPAWRGVLEAFLEFIQQPSCRVVLGTILLLGGGGLLLWAQRKRTSKLAPASAQGESAESHNAEESWIKSHFSCLSKEKLALDNHASTSNNAIQPESGGGKASTTIRVETVTSRHGEGATRLHRESVTSRQKMSGSSVTKETHKESGKPSSMDEATWAGVAACVKEIDIQGQRVADSMLQRATAYQHSGHLDSRDINPEELKALEEVEMKLKRSFLTQRETTTAGANHTRTFYGHQSHPGHPSHQNHAGHPSHQSQMGHQSHQSQTGHQSHQNHTGHQSHQSHSLPNRSHQMCNS
ncbi:uncharacterized protein C10orf62 homolog [Octodon degus]|uniref:Uncharacterized protein C10orf62 homolog n=1 Tax=Octodon degus TaxID=10160 RepID=A0A6P6DXJ2_OCTDE|nr:uncharacterized protein C10orf62 homolog [Octodon degus]